MLSPTNVLPAPGTPVTKQIALKEFARADSMISRIVSEVTVRFITARTIRNGAIVIKRHCGFDDRWRGRIPPTLPLRWIDLSAIGKVQNTSDHHGEQLHIPADRREHLVDVHSGRDHGCCWWRIRSSTD